MTGGEKLVAGYLRELRRELRGVPRARRAEILDDVTAHREQARAEAAGEAELLTLIDRLGTPAEIAAEARDPRTPRRGWVEILALVLLPVGGVVVPVVGWLVGLALLWASGVWTLRDKLIGTLLVPGGLLPFIALLTLSAGECADTGSIGPGGRIVRTATCDSGPNWWLVALAVVLLVAPIASTAYLGWRTRPRTETPAPFGVAVPSP
jgi:HAAS domain-containing protein